MVLLSIGVQACVVAPKPSTPPATASPTPAVFPLKVSSNGRYLVHTGAGILWTDDQNDSVQFRARPQVHEGPFLLNTGPLAADMFTNANLEFATVWGPFSAQSELFISNVDMLTGKILAANLRDGSRLRCKIASGSCSGPSR